MTSLEGRRGTAVALFVVDRCDGCDDRV